MVSDVDNYCKSCVECAMRKPAIPVPVAEMQSIQVKNIMEMIEMDICGPYKLSSSGNKYSLVVTEYFSKWAEPYAIPNFEAKTVVQKLEEILSINALSTSVSLIFLVFVTSK